MTSHRTLTSHRRPAAAQPPAADQRPGLDDFVFLGYREKAKQPNWVQCMNAGGVDNPQERAGVLLDGAVVVPAA